jgi:hypothetical protein
MSPLDTSLVVCDHKKREYISAENDLLRVVEICDTCDTMTEKDSVRFIHREKED